MYILYDTQTKFKLEQLIHYITNLTRLFYLNKQY